MSVTSMGPEQSTLPPRQRLRMLYLVFCEAESIEMHRPLPSNKTTQAPSAKEGAGYPIYTRTIISRKRPTHTKILAAVFDCLWTRRPRGQNNVLSNRGDQVRRERFAPNSFLPGTMISVRRPGTKGLESGSRNGGDIMQETPKWRFHAPINSISIRPQLEVPAHTPA